MIELSVLTKKILTISMINGIGPANLRKIIDNPDFANATIDDLVKVNPKLKNYLNKSNVWDKALAAAERQIEQADQHNACIISSLDKDYPQLLKISRDDPVILYLRGQLAPQPEHSVAIIGTREPTKHGEIIAKRITQFFIDNDWSIVSGLAYGCDAIAHQTAIAARGHTVAVLAHGLQTIAPANHRDLAQAILDTGGALVSQYPFGRTAIPQQFAQRDLTQAGLARGVVMIQSDLTGGSLHASRAALKYNRWLAIPFPTETDRSGEYSLKVQANMMLAEGTAQQKMDLLKCKDAAALSKIVILRSREDYSGLLMKISIA